MVENSLGTLGWGRLIPKWTCDSFSAPENCVEADESTSAPDGTRQDTASTGPGWPTRRPDAEAFHR